MFVEENRIFYLSSLFPLISAWPWYRILDIRYQILGIGYCISDQNIGSHIWLRWISDNLLHRKQKQNVFSGFTTEERCVAVGWSFSSHSADLIKHLYRYNTHTKIINIWPIRTRRQVYPPVNHVRCQVRKLCSVVLGRTRSLSCELNTSTEQRLETTEQPIRVQLHITEHYNAYKYPQQSLTYTEHHL